MSTANGQQQIPGTEDKKDALLTKLAQEYVEKRNARQEATRLEVERKTILIQKMQEKGVTYYRDPELDIEVQLKQGKANVKVVTPDDEPAAEDGDESDDES